MNAQVIVVGAGICGLRTASLLAQHGIDVALLEARERIGGRVLSMPVHTGAASEQRFDLGATWFWPEHNQRMAVLVKGLGVETVAQHDAGDLLIERSTHQSPQRLGGGWDSPRALRLASGAQDLADALARSLPERTIKLGAQVTSLEANAGGTVTVRTASNSPGCAQLSAQVVVLAMPARVIARQVTFIPALDQVQRHALHATPTWMAGQAKAVAIYTEAFWRAEGLSGKVMSAVGPLQEIHDASPLQGGGALLGFFQTPPMARANQTESDLRSQVLAQLGRLFGPRAQTPIDFLYKDWATDPLTATREDLTTVQGHTRGALAQVSSGWSGKLAISGTESSSGYGGYLEGALDAAETARDHCLRVLSK